MEIINAFRFTLTLCFFVRVGLMVLKMRIDVGKTGKFHIFMFDSIYEIEKRPMFDMRLPTHRQCGNCTSILLCLEANQRSMNCAQRIENERDSENKGGTHSKRIVYYHAMG